MSQLKGGKSVFDYIRPALRQCKQKRPLFRVAFFDVWLREPDLNRRPSGYEPDELPDCSIPRLCWPFYRNTRVCQPAILIKPVPVQSLSCKLPHSGGLRGRHGKGCGSIGVNFSIEKINFWPVPTNEKDPSGYWCYIQLSVRYCFSYTA